MVNLVRFDTYLPIRGERISRDGIGRHAAVEAVPECVRVRVPS